MHASDWIAIVAVLLGGGGSVTGGIGAIARLTRLAVAVEGLVESMKTVVTTVQGHETRIATLEGQQQAKP